MVEPRRRCIGCGATRAKREFIRIVLVDHRLRIDGLQKMGRRGAYLCNSKCARNAARRRLFSRAFRQKVALDGAEAALVEEMDALGL